MSLSVSEAIAAATIEEKVRKVIGQPSVQKSDVNLQFLTLNIINQTSNKNLIQK